MFRINEGIEQNGISWLAPLFLLLLRRGFSYSLVSCLFIYWFGGFFSHQILNAYDLGWYLMEKMEFHMPCSSHIINYISVAWHDQKFYHEHVKWRQNKNNKKELHRFFLSSAYRIHSFGQIEHSFCFFVVNQWNKVNWYSKL